MKSRIGLLSILLFCFFNQIKSQPIVHKDDIVKLIKLSLTERVDVVEQELKANGYKVIKKNKPYELDGMNHIIDTKFDFSALTYYKLPPNDYNHKLTTGYSIDYSKNSAMEIVDLWFCTSGLDFQIDRAYSLLKSYFKNTYNVEYTGSTDVIVEFNSKPNGEKFFILDGQLARMQDFIYDGYSSVFFKITFMKPKL